MKINATVLKCLLLLALALSAAPTGTTAQDARRIALDKRYEVNPETSRLAEVKRAYIDAFASQDTDASGGSRLAFQQAESDLRAPYADMGVNWELASSEVAAKGAAALANDNLADAIAILDASFSVLGSNVDATNEDGSGETRECGIIGSTIWYTWTAPGNGLLEISTNNDDRTYDTVLSIHTGANYPLTNIACNDDSVGLASTITIPVVGGTIYRIRVGGFGVAQGTFRLVGTFTGPTENDDLQNALPTGPAPFTVTGSTAIASVEGPELGDTCAPSERSIWWYYTATTNGTLHLDTYRPGFNDTVLSTWTGTDHPLTPQACNDDMVPFIQYWSTLDVPVQAGVTYYIRVSLYEDTIGLGSAITLNGFLYGDLNGTGSVSAADLTAFLNLARSQGPLPIPATVNPAADVTGDEDIDVYDLVWIALRYQRRVTCYPVDPLCVIPPQYAAWDRKAGGLPALSWGTPRPADSATPGSLEIPLEYVGGDMHLFVVDIPLDPTVTVTRVTSTLPANWQLDSFVSEGSQYLVASGDEPLVRGEILQMHLRPSGPATFAGTVMDVMSGMTQSIDPVAIPGLELPSHFELRQNFPNPFNPTTSIQYAVPESSPIRLAVYDMLGREVALLVDGLSEAGVHQVQFSGSMLPSGTYFVRLQTAGGTFTNTMQLLK